MTWRESILETLAARPVCGYGLYGSAATEPTALTALALLAEGRTGPASRAIRWLTELQTPEGSVGIGRQAATPRWPTSLAVLAWAGLKDHPAIDKRINAATAWICGQKVWCGETTPVFGHDLSIPAWSWVEETHSWIEPTALNVLALKATQRHRHPRVREAIRMLLDRQLPDGGCNYGNTSVMGTVLRPHPQPTGLALLALTKEPSARSHIARSVAYLKSVIDQNTTTVSLCWALLGLAASGAMPEAGTDWLKRAFYRVEQQDRSPYKFALIALAALGEDSPLVALPARAKVEKGLSQGLATESRLFRRGTRQR